MRVRSLDDLAAAGKRALVRVDLNVPMEDGEVGDTTRIAAVVPTVERLASAGARVILLSHFGRPKGRRESSMSLAPLVAPLARALGRPVAFAADCVGEAARDAVEAMAAGDILLLENVRFHEGEEANDPAFARAVAANGDVYVDDAFSAAHRAHATTEAIAHILPAYAGEAMRAEIAALTRVLSDPARPLLGVVGGSKVSTKLELLTNLVGRLDALAIGGGMANTFLYAAGCEVGGSYCERDLAHEARHVRALAAKGGCEILLPLDIVVAERAAPGVAYWTRALGEIDADERILDAGPKTVARLCAAIDAAKTLVWNGPLGVFETPPFDRATTAAARHAALRVKEAGLIAVAGGGDTVAALNRAGVAEDFTFVSNAGGAFLEWLEGKTLPGIAALERAARR